MEVYRYAIGFFLCERFPLIDWRIAIFLFIAIITSLTLIAYFPKASNKFTFLSS